MTWMIWESQAKLMYVFANSFLKIGILINWSNLWAYTHKLK